MHVPFNDPARQARSLGAEIAGAIDEVVASGWYVHGRKHQAFEEAFAAYCGVETCVGVANGTDALEIALRAVGCGPGSEVVTVANAGGYTTTACIAAGATPVFADIEDDTLEMSLASLERALSPRTRAVVITHLYGYMAEVGALAALARSRGVAVIEDCAQAHGAMLGGRRAGSFGDLACFSFYPTKNLGALGDGGAIVTNDGELAEKCRMLRQYGWAGKYDARIAGGRNSRLDELQAAVLLVKLPHLDGWNERRREVVERYRQAASESSLGLVHEPGPDYVAHLCVAVHPDRDAARGWLLDAGVETAVHYPIPDHRQAALAGVAWRGSDLRVTERASGSVLSLPCYPELTDAEVEHVARALRELG